MIMKKVYEEAAQKIKSGEKYTILMFNDFGFPVTLHTVIYKAYVGSYAQYNNMLYIEHKPKRKRTVYKMPILPYQEVYIWEGWLDIDNDSFWKTKQNGDMTVKISRMSFDKEFLRQQVNKTKIRPFAILDRDYYVNTEEIEYIYQVVTENGTEYYTLLQLEAHYNVVGKNYNRNNRIELQNQPILSGLIGPMWNGYVDGKAVIRYESREIYALMSN